jgi:hypothetical protein
VLIPLSAFALLYISWSVWWLTRPRRKEDERIALMTKIGLGLTVAILILAWGNWLFGT